ncbi:AraC family transcriptional regulator [Stutzerimonas azotifigens]|uniref:AraC family transcriptional regulator n=1 Tax=Stutzerimonas azotifigens TaxID=291995 RepID=UPI00042237AC|nr:AraC family transcriptional regulator [Stutzerimonas azotifigens]
MTAGWYEGDTRFIPGHYQPGVLIDLALGRGLDSHRVLRGTGLFHDDFPSGTVRLSPQQFLQLIANAWPLLGRDETAFLYGQRLLPGHYGAASQALAQAAHLQEALEVLVEQQALLSPLLKPRVQMDEGQVQLAWLDACGCGEVQRFVLEASMAAVASACHWLAGERLPWRFEFRHARPRHIEQYWAHLSDALRFDCPRDRMLLPREWLHRPWPKGSATAARVARQEARRQLDTLGMEASLLGRLHDHLEALIREPLNLERVAAAFGLSPATLKRRLQKHGTHFQALLDQARLQVALDLYESRGYTNDEVAAYLRFNDTTNFRRSFKRWAGASPSALRHVLGLVS